MGGSSQENPRSSQGKRPSLLQSKPNDPICALRNTLDPKVKTEPNWEQHTYTSLAQKSPGGQVNPL